MSCVTACIGWPSAFTARNAWRNAAEAFSQPLARATKARRCPEREPAGQPAKWSYGTRLHQPNAPIHKPASLTLRVSVMWRSVIAAGHAPFLCGRRRATWILIAGPAFKAFDVFKGGRSCFLD